LFFVLSTAGMLIGKPSAGWWLASQLAGLLGQQLAG